MTTSVCYCTYFDARYLPRGLTLLDSLRAHCAPFRLWILALDSECESVLRGMCSPDVQVVNLHALESFDARLLKAKGTRTQVEYFFTCTAALVAYVREQEALDLTVYLDADMMFFSSPEPVFCELAGKSVGIIEHGFLPRMEHLSVHGKYNVGWVSFARDDEATRCLNDWRDSCLEWCFDRVDRGRFADQGYLDLWPSSYARVCVISHPGANLAPWNVAARSVRFGVDGIAEVNGRPLVFYHFHALTRLGTGVYDVGLSQYGGRLRKEVAKRIYLPYIKSVERFANRDSAFQTGRYLASCRNGRLQNAPGRWLRLLRRIATSARAGDMLAVLGERVVCP